MELTYLLQVNLIEWKHRISHDLYTNNVHFSLVWRKPLKYAKKEGYLLDRYPLFRVLIG